MTKTVLLNAPEGITDLSVGSVVCQVSDGTVEIPEEAVEFLLQFGFSVKAEEPKKGRKKAAKNEE